MFFDASYVKPFEKNCFKMQLPKQNTQQKVENEDFLAQVLVGFQTLRPENHEKNGVPCRLHLGIARGAFSPMRALSAFDTSTQRAFLINLRFGNSLIDHSTGAVHPERDVGVVRVLWVPEHHQLCRQKKKIADVQHKATLGSLLSMFVVCEKETHNVNNVSFLCFPMVINCPTIAPRTPEEMFWGS